MPPYLLADINTIIDFKGRSSWFTKDSGFLTLPLADKKRQNKSTKIGDKIGDK